MRFVMVVAHPAADSFTHALASAAETALRAAGHEVTVYDLYRIGFTAAMSTAERVAYHTPQPVIDPQVAAMAAAVGDAEGLVFVYPTWWSTMPAILKCWMERVLVPGVAFRFDGKGRVRPALCHVRHLVGISTYGSSRWYVRLMHDNGRRTIMRALRLNTGWRTRRAWFGLYSMDSASADDRARFVQSVDQRLRAL